MAGSSYVWAGQPVTAADLDSSYAFSDATPFTVTATSLTQVSNSFQIAAAEPNAGSVYRLRAYGVGTQGSTAQQLQFAASLGGVNTGTGLTFGSGFAGTGATFHWMVEAEAYCVSTGSGATWQLSLTGSCGASTSLTLTGTAQNGTAISVPTTAAIAFFIQADWGSATGAPTTTSLRSVLERVL